jgi:hypothetical protein
MQIHKEAPLATSNNYRTLILWFRHQFLMPLYLLCYNTRNYIIFSSVTSCTTP